MKNTPKLFKKRIQQLIAKNLSDDEFEAEAGKMMFKVLSSLGYDEGLTLFKGEVFRRNLEKTTEENVS